MDKDFGFDGKGLLRCLLCFLFEKCEFTDLPSWNDFADWVGWWEFTILPSLMLVEKWRKYERFDL
ncbi:hypothetical protein Hanom_Chr01g00035501 [Helianthus anomalus]